MSKPVYIPIDEYDYELPEERIAKYPLRKRDDSLLLCYDRSGITSRPFHAVDQILEKGDELIFNTTKVIQARLEFSKSTGARIEVFCLEPLEPYDYQMAFGSTGPVLWKCLLGNARKWKDGKLSADIHMDNNIVTFNADKRGYDGDKYLIEFSWSNKNYSFSDLLERAGSTPIPPYLRRKAESSDAGNYQTVYARHKGSVAAPTAGLHFTNQILDRLNDKNVIQQEITLHVGAGTFIPVKQENAVEHSMHEEWVQVDRKLITALKRNVKRRIAVGTTSVRSLESIFWLGIKALEDKNFNFDLLVLTQWEAYELGQDHSLEDALNALIEKMDLFGLDSFHFHTGIMITPGYRFRVIDAFFTNFHQPKSTLLLLVAAAVGKDWRRIYQYAMENDFRFLSYGDSSLLVLPK